MVTDEGIFFHRLVNLRKKITMKESFVAHQDPLEIQDEMGWMERMAIMAKRENQEMSGRLDP